MILSNASPQRGVVQVADHRPCAHWRKISTEVTRVVCAIVIVIYSAGCGNKAEEKVHDAPDRPVREYFAALAAGDMKGAYVLSRSSRDWLLGDALKTGYQAPANLQVIRIDNGVVDQQVNGQIAYVRVRYRLAAFDFESSVEVWRHQDTGRWFINSGATGRMDVISRTPQIRIANRDVTTSLTTHRAASRYPGRGYFELPPGVYTVTLSASAANREPLTVPVPAAWRGGWPVQVELAPA